MRPTGSTRPDHGAVIPTGVAATMAGPVAGTMTARVSLSDGGTHPEYDTRLGRTVEVPNAPYSADVPAKITPRRSDPRSPIGGDEEQSTVQYLVSLPADQPVGAGHHVLVTATTDDATLVGKYLEVDDVLHGSLVWQRDVVATLTT